MNPLDFSRIKDEAHPEDFLSEMKPFGDLMMYYRCAMMEVETKFKVLNEIGRSTRLNSSHPSSSRMPSSA